MRIVLDTNVLVSALIKPFSVPASILSLIMEQKVEICYDSRIITEYKKVLSRKKFGFNKHDIKSLLEYLQKEGHLCNAPSLGITVSDKSDLPFMEVAAASKAEYIVTGNISHFPVKIKSVKVVSPRVFLNKNF